MWLYRIQDDQGRGPFKPGESLLWSDTDGEARPFDLDTLLAARSRLRGAERMATACRTMEQLQQWFSPTEMRTLREMGYRLVRVRPHRILGENDNEVFFAMKYGPGDRRNLKRVRVCAWPFDDGGASCSPSTSP